MVSQPVCRCVYNRAKVEDGTCLGCGGKRHEGWYRMVLEGRVGRITKKDSEDLKLPPPEPDELETDPGMLWDEEVTE